MATRELGYDNLFLFCDWADSPSNGLLTTAQGETLAVDRDAGSLTITSKGQQHIITKYGNNSSYYNIPVKAGTKYRISLTQSGTSVQSQVYVVYLTSSFAYIPQGSYNYAAVTTSSGSGAKSGEFTTPSGCAYIQVFFDVHDANKSMTFANIRICPASCYVDPSITVRKAVTYDANSAAAYGTLATPAQTGRIFGGWFTGENGTGTRVTEHGRIQDRNITVFAKWLSPVIFGGNGCPSIEVGPFTPICDRPEIGGSEPMALSIPVPSFAPAVPPEDCVCFQFSEGTSTAAVSTSCDETKTKASLKLNIKPAADCCSGSYTIDPELAVTIPCVPFEFEAASAEDQSIKVKNRSGNKDNGIDGAVSVLGLRKPPGKCCSVQPVIDITMPDCKKYYNPADVPKVQIEYCENVAGVAQTKTHQLIEMVQDTDNCSLYPKVNPLTLPCCTQADWTNTVTKNLGHGGKITITMSRTNCQPSFSVDVTPVSVHFPVIPSFCLADATANVTVTYTDSDDEEHTVTTTNGLKLTAGEEGACKKYTPSLSIGLGKLDISTISNGGDVFQDSSGNLHINGAPASGATTWYGGGLGDLTDNVHAADIECRGPLMRGYTSPVNTLVTHATDIAPRLTTANGGNSTQGWTSNRKTNQDELDKSGWTDGGIHYAYGILDMVLPSGAQWHERGLALTLSHFVWDGSGVLSYMNETPRALLVSPSPLVTKVSGVYRNTSGLAIWTPSDQIPSGTVPGEEHGLQIRTGAGMRVFGRINDRTTAAESQAAGSADRFGDLEVYAYEGDFAFGDANDESSGGAAVGKLVMNDQMTLRNSTTADEIKAFGTTSNAATAFPQRIFTRNTDCLVPVIAPYYALPDKTTGQPAYWGKDTVNIWRPKTAKMFGRATNAAYYGTNAAGVTSFYKYNDNNVQTTDVAATIQGRIDDLWNYTNGSFTAREAFQKYVYPALRTIADAIADLAAYAMANANLLTTFGITHLHFAKSGVLMQADGGVTNSIGIARRVTTRLS